MRKSIHFILLLLLSVTAIAQRSISGKITDSNGEPLIGANILAKGTNNATISDVTGTYRFNVNTAATVLVVSYVGYTSQEITLGTSNIVDVRLQEGTEIEETVVTALGISRSEKSLGYAVQKIQGEDLTKVKDANVINALSGRIAGVNITGSSGNLGGSARITIRGIRSLTGENQPLFVVDGIPMDNSNITTNAQRDGGGGFDYGNAIQDLNPDDIENISVLKGQSATALYGSRGSNGVIMITLKNGSKQKKKTLGISFNSSLTTDRVLLLPTYQNEYGGGVDLRPLGRTDGKGHYKTTLVQMGTAGDTVGVFSSYDLTPIYGVDESWGAAFNTTSAEHMKHLDGLKFGNGKNRYYFPKGFGASENKLNYRKWNSFDAWDTDNYLKSSPWEATSSDINQFYETGKTYNNNISITGGNEKAGFRASYTNLNQVGVMPNSSLQRNTFSLAGNVQLTERLSATASGNFVVANVKGRSETGYSSNSQNVAQNFNQWWHRQLNISELKEYKNPDGSMRTWNRKSPTNAAPNFWDNPYWMRYENYQTDGRNRFFGNMTSTYKISKWLSATGRLLHDEYNEHREERLASGGYNISKFQQGFYNVRETNMDMILRANTLLDDLISVDAFVGGNRMYRYTKQNIQATRDGLNVPNFFNLKNSVGRINIVDDLLSKKRINSIFGGLSLGYKSFMYVDITGRNDWSSTLPAENNRYFYPSISTSFIFSELIKTNFLSYGKLRLGWAKVGNDTDPYRLGQTFNSEDNFGSAPSFSTPNTLNNANLKPEITSNTEIGLETRFFKDRIGLDVTLYTGKSTNQILPISTSGATGFTRQYINAGEVSNKGIEIALTVTPVRRSNFTWDLGFNLGKNTNKVVDLNVDDASLTNLPMGELWFTSVNAYEGRSYGTLLGKDYLRDGNGNRLTNADGLYLHTNDVVPIGSVLPDFTGGVSSRFLLFKNLSINVLVDFRKGGDIFSTTNMWGKYAGLFSETTANGIRKDGIIVPGKLAKLDADGNPILSSEGDPTIKGDETYESSGEDNKVSVDGQTHYFENGGYIIQAADVYDGSFVKLREMSLGYTLPRKWFGQNFGGDVTLSIVGRNLAILYKNIPHLDPDNAISTQNVQGLEGGQFPSLRSLGFNLNVKF